KKENKANHQKTDCQKDKIHVKGFLSVKGDSDKTDSGLERGSGKKAGPRGNFRASKVNQNRGTAKSSNGAKRGKQVSFDVSTTEIGCIEKTRRKKDSCFGLGQKNRI